MTFRASHIASATKMHGKIDARLFRNITMAAIFTLIFSGFSFNFGELFEEFSTIFFCLSYTSFFNFL